MSAKPVDIEILGREFTVSCTDEEYDSLMQAAQYLDSKMRDIRDTAKIAGIERIAIMAALNITHEMLNSKAGGVNYGDIKRRMLALESQIDDTLAPQNKLL